MNLIYYCVMTWAQSLCDGTSESRVQVLQVNSNFKLSAETTRTYGICFCRTTCVQPYEGSRSLVQRSVENGQTGSIAAHWAPIGAIQHPLSDIPCFQTQGNLNKAAS